jgi:hypothetical protein
LFAPFLPGVVTAEVHDGPRCGVALFRWNWIIRYIRVITLITVIMFILVIKVIRVIKVIKAKGLVYHGLRFKIALQGWYSSEV